MERSRGQLFLRQAICRGEERGERKHHVRKTHIMEKLISHLNEGREVALWYMQSRQPHDQRLA